MKACEVIKMLQLCDFRVDLTQVSITQAMKLLNYWITTCGKWGGFWRFRLHYDAMGFLFTYKRDAGSQQQDPDQEIFKLLNHQLPDGLAWERR